MVCYTSVSKEADRMFFFFCSLPISIWQEGYEVCAGVLFFISSNEGYRNTTVL